MQSPLLLFALLVYGLHPQFQTAQLPPQNPLIKPDVGTPGAGQCWGICGEMVERIQQVPHGLNYH